MCDLPQNRLRQEGTYIIFSMTDFLVFAGPKLPDQKGGQRKKKEHLVLMSFAQKEETNRIFNLQKGLRGNC